MNLRDQLEKSLPPEILRATQAIGQLADQQKRRAVLVGGVVRDLILNLPAGDADFMVEHPAQPLVEALAKNLGTRIISHERFLTFTLALSADKKIDIVTAREETYPASAKLPDVVPSTIEKDLKRRDFTINAIACWLNREHWGDTLDPFTGEEDIRAKYIRVLHPGSFKDDPTRIFRGARFAGRLGFRVEPETETRIREAVAKNIPGFLTPVRRRHEFELILREKNPSAAFEMLQKWGALKFLHPEWAMLDAASLPFGPEGNLVDRLAVWFGPFGKDRALGMMTDLNFEKEVKHKVATKLVQSPSTS